MMQLTIDGKFVTAQPEETILSVAERNGVRIPTLCYLKKMSPIGSCRMCMVEVDGADQGTQADGAPVAAA